MLAPFTVNSLLDNGDGANTTLREAIETANVNPDADTITFALALNGGVITITGGSLVATNRVTITGPTGAADRITIQKGAGSLAIAG